MPTKILQRDALELRRPSKEVPLADIGSKKIQTLLRNMIDSLEAEDDGVAIAAPQIGVNLRIFIVSGKTFLLLNRKKGDPETEEKSPEPMTFINPEIIRLSKKKKPMEEGCLSVRWLYGQVERSEKATIRAVDENGRKFQMGASGLLAQIFQHETDHLNGILFIDTATDLKDMPPEHEHKD